MCAWAKPRRRLLAEDPEHSARFRNAVFVRLGEKIKTGFSLGLWALFVWALIVGLVRTAGKKVCLYPQLVCKQSGGRWRREDP